MRAWAVWLRLCLAHGTILTLANCNPNHSKNISQKEGKKQKKKKQGSNLEQVFSYSRNGSCNTGNNCSLCTSNNSLCSTQETQLALSINNKSAANRRAGKHLVTMRAAFSEGKLLIKLGDWSWSHPESETVRSEGCSDPWWEIVRFDGCVFIVEGWVRKKCEQLMVFVLESMSCATGRVPCFHPRFWFWAKRELEQNHGQLSGESLCFLDSC